MNPKAIPDILMPYLGAIGVMILFFVVGSLMLRGHGRGMRIEDEPPEKHRAELARPDPESAEPA